jgi:membrane-bound serine protease (ClpP class)
MPDVTTVAERRVRPLRTLLVPFLALLAWAAAAPVRAAATQVAAIDVHGYLSMDMASFVNEQIDQAWRDGDAGVILDIDTTSGSDEAAQAVKQTIVDRTATGTFPIVAYIHDHAEGPGALVALACRTIALAPAASFGNAKDSTDVDDFKSTAQFNNRNPAIAAAFISDSTQFPQLGQQVVLGEPLTLTTQQAMAVGYGDVVASDYPAVLQKMNLANASIAPVQFDVWTGIARWIAQPWATILLLALGLALVIVEMMTWHSWGIAGLIGGIIVLTIFWAHIAVGNGNWVGLIIFVLGLALLLFETHVLPGHGVSAVAGLILIAVGMFFALGGTQGNALFPLAGTFLTTIGIMIAFFIYLPRSRVWNKLGQPMRQSAAAGYVSSEDYTGYLGAMGVTATLLRPSGTAEFEGVRLPVVSEGDFIQPGTHVQVVTVQGSRIVVKSLD